MSAPKTVDLEADVPDAHDVRSLVREACSLKCNPSGLQQRLVSGGRNKEKYFAKMESYKTNCALGCFLAVNANLSLDTAQQQSIEKWGSKGDDKKILSGSQVTSELNQLAKWMEFLQDSCGNRCYTACQTRPGDQEKCFRQCGTGCEKYFEILRS